MRSATTLGIIIAVSALACSAPQTKGAQEARPPASDTQDPATAAPSVGTDTGPGPGKAAPADDPDNEDSNYQPSDDAPLRGID